MLNPTTQRTILICTNPQFSTPLCNTPLCNQTRGNNSPVCNTILGNSYPLFNSPHYSFLINNNNNNSNNNGSSTSNNSNNNNNNNNNSKPHFNPISQIIHGTPPSTWDRNVSPPARFASAPNSTITPKAPLYNTYLSLKSSTLMYHSPRSNLSMVQVVGTAIKTRPNRCKRPSRK